MKVNFGIWLSNITFFLCLHISVKEETYPCFVSKNLSKNYTKEFLLKMQSNFFQNRVWNYNAYKYGDFTASNFAR